MRNRFNGNALKEVAVVIVFFTVLATIGCSYSTQVKVLHFAGYCTEGDQPPSKPMYLLYEQVVDQFNKSHERTGIQWETGIVESDYKEWLYGRLIIGEEPDVFIVNADMLSDLVAKGAVLPLENLMHTEGNDFDTTFFYASALGQGRINNRQYGLPFISQPTLMAVNTSLLSEVGASVPKKNWQWMDFHALCRTLTTDINDDGLLDRFGVTGYTWKEAVYANDGRIFNRALTASTVTQRNFSNSIQFLYAINTLNNGQGTNHQDFEKGNVGFMPMDYATFEAYKSYPGKIQKYTDFEWTCLPMPAGPDGDNISEVDSLFCVISARSKMKEEAWELVKLLTTDKSIQQSVYRYTDGVSPIKIEYLHSESDPAPLEWESEWIDRSLIDYVMARARYDDQISGFSDFSGIIEKEMESVMEDNTNIQVTLMSIEKQINAKLNQ